MTTSTQPLCPLHDIRTERAWQLARRWDRAGIVVGQPTAPTAKDAAAK